MSEKDIYLGDPVWDGDDEIGWELFDEGFNYIGPKVLLFELNVG